jgi:hypothetical protein
MPPRIGRVGDHKLDAIALRSGALQRSGRDPPALRTAGLLSPLAIQRQPASSQITPGSSAGYAANPYAYRVGTLGKRAIRMAISSGCGPGGSPQRRGTSPMPPAASSGDGTPPPVPRPVLLTLAGVGPHDHPPGVAQGQHTQVHPHPLLGNGPPHTERNPTAAACPVGFQSSLWPVGFNPSRGAHSLAPHPTPLVAQPRPLRPHPGRRRPHHRAPAAVGHPLHRCLGASVPRCRRSRSSSRMRSSGCRRPEFNATPTPPTEPDSSSS